MGGAGSAYMADVARVRFCIVFLRGATHWATLDGDEDVDLENSMLLVDPMRGV